MISAYDRRRIHPQVDHVDLGIATDRVHVAPRRRRPRDVHGVAGRHDADDFLGVAVDDRDLAGIAQRDREEIIDIALVLRLLRPILGRDHDFPARHHVRHAELRRCRRLLLQEARHDVDLRGSQVTGCTPVRHAGRRTVGDQCLEVFGAFRLRNVRRQRLAGRALAQHAVAAGAALEIQLGSRMEFGLRQRRPTGRHDLARVFAGDRGRRTLVFQLTFGGTDMTLPGGAVFLAEFRAQCGHFRDADGGTAVAPGAEYVAQHGRKILVRQVSHARHHAVVLHAVDRNRARQAEQRGRHDVLAIALQKIRFGQRRKRARKALAVRLMAGRAIGEVYRLAFRHHGLTAAGRDFRGMYSRVGRRARCRRRVRRRVGLLGAGPECEGQGREQAWQSEFSMLHDVFSCHCVYCLKENYQFIFRLRDALLPACARYGSNGSDAASPRTSDQFQ